MKKIIDLAGYRYGRLIVLSRNFTKKRTAWNCICDCGNETIARTAELRNGDTKSCGCYQRQQTRLASITHGQSTNDKRSSGSYKSWSDMKRRCYAVNNKNYSDYGGRGIFVCDEWRDSFEVFFKSMGIRPDGMTLDRIDVNDGYHPGNCKWSSRLDQVNNARSNVMVKTPNALMTTPQFAALVGIKYNTVRQSIRRGNRTFNGIDIEVFKRG